MFFPDYNTVSAIISVTQFSKAQEKFIGKCVEHHEKIVNFFSELMGFYIDTFSLQLFLFFLQLFQLIAMWSCQVLVSLGETTDRTELRNNKMKKLQHPGNNISFKMIWKPKALIIQTSHPLAPLQTKMCSLDILM